MKLIINLIYLQIIIIKYLKSIDTNKINNLNLFNVITTNNEIQILIMRKYMK